MDGGSAVQRLQDSVHAGSDSLNGRKVGVPVLCVKPCRLEGAASVPSGLMKR